MESNELLVRANDWPMGDGVQVDEDPELVPGDHVSLGFRGDAGLPEMAGARMAAWMFVEVTAVEGAWPDAVYRGKLCSLPMVGLIRPRVRFGQLVEFRVEHIEQTCVVHDSPARPEGEREQQPPKLVRDLKDAAAYVGRGAVG
jgi:hypothetical protein